MALARVCQVAYSPPNTSFLRICFPMFYENRLELACMFHAFPCIATNSLELACMLHVFPDVFRSRQVGRLSVGSCFGATAALHGGGVRRESVTCVTDCEMYTIEGKALRRIAR